MLYLRCGELIGHRRQYTESPPGAHSVLNDTQNACSRISLPQPRIKAKP